MTALAEPLKAPRPLLELLAIELAPREGRWAAVTRIAMGAVIAVVLAMLFQIPEPTYMAYIGFLLSKDEKNASVTAALGGFAAATLAVLLVLGLELIDTAEPALRLPLMAASTFAAMYTARTFALGPVTFLAGFVIVLLQTLVDDVHSTEALTRITLWAWLVIAIPVAITVIVNIVFGQSAVALLDRSVRKILQELETALTRATYRDSLPVWRARLLPLLETAQHVATKGPEAGSISPAVIRALLDALVVMEALPGELPQAVQQELVHRVRACRLAIGGGTPSSSESWVTPAPIIGAASEQAPALLALRGALFEALNALLHPAPVPAHKDAPHPPKRLLVPDAFSNPAHWQFALKTTMAVMASYAVYSLLAWPGMRTAVVTCFFVALSSLGETVHKLLLRLTGAAIGGLISCVCIVFVLPHLTDIGQLSLLVGFVSVGAAWVATSSELLSYAGLQIAFAFFLGILQGYGPATDLTVLRDRIAGILLGNIVITLVFSTFWPQSARSAVRAALAETLRAIGAVIRRPAQAADARLRTVQALVRADHFRTLSLFELRMLPQHVQASQGLPGVTDMERLAGAAFVVAADALSPLADSGAVTRLADWADSAADDILQNRALPPRPRPIATAPPAASPSARTAERAVHQLESEVAHVAAAMH
jgi:multidrug resistance protein MdtO